MPRTIVRGPLGPECLELGVGMYPPYMRYELPPEDYFHGPSLEIMKILAKKLNFCFRINYPVDTPFGQKLANGSWDGLMGKLIKREYEWVIPPFAYSMERGEVIDYSSPLLVDDHNAVFAYPKFEADVTGFVRPFTYTVWVWLLVSSIITILSMWVMSIVIDASPIPSSTSSISQNKKISREIDKVTSLGNAMMTVVRPLLGQGLWESLRVYQTLIGLWLMMCMIVGTVYKSNLMSKLIAPKVKIPFTSFEEMIAKRNEVPYYIIGGSYFHSIAKDSPPKSLVGRILSGGTISNNILEMRNGLLEGSHALFNYRISNLNVIHLQYTQFGTCKVTPTKTTIAPATQSIGFKKGSVWKKKIDPLIIRLNECGIIRKLLDDSLSNANKCFNPEKQEGPGLKPLEMKDFYGIFILYLGGILLSALVFLVEVNRGWNHLEMLQHVVGGQPEPEM